MQSPDPGTRKLIVVGLVVVSFIAGAVCSMAGLRWVHIAPTQNGGAGRTAAPHPSR